MKLRIESVTIDERTGKASMLVRFPWGDSADIPMADARYVCLPAKSRINREFGATLATFLDAARFDILGDMHHSYNYAKGLV